MLVSLTAATLVVSSTAATLEVSTTGKTVVVSSVAGATVVVSSVGVPSAGAKGLVISVLELMFSFLEQPIRVEIAMNEAMKRIWKGIKTKRYISRIDDA